MYLEKRLIQRFHCYGRKVNRLNAIEVHNLNKKFKHFQLDDINFELPTGYIMGLIGANGAGKTTLLRILMGLYIKDSGDITVLDEDPFSKSKEIHQHIGFVFDNPKFYDFKLKKIAKIIKPFYKNWNTQKFSKYLEKFELSEHLRFKTLSRGMKLKFALAIALSHDAKLLILDEPTSGLDPVFRIEFLELLQELIEDGKRSILFSSHITGDVEKIADYITYIKSGQIIFSENRDNIMNGYLLVKGGDDYIPDSIKTIMISGRTSSYNYEALIPREHGIDKVWQQEEQPTLEQIMYAYEKR